jgi:hypothetical protein
MESSYRRIRALILNTPKLLLLSDLANLTKVVRKQVNLVFFEGPSNVEADFREDSYFEL